ncbi:zinc finger protein 800 isoform X1 [Malaclemys terrapin pileata]|uniref:zinc finger protein 800 isoform X1 n=2 Tax=Malaclemys terrapin pileata TaxID=2991368 RepID=UPI0023A90C88|nr:zinc finger protein 800 isoform X1 [Malaclemys terrapin pileata]XP_053878686.1 zinc finger protein 800 isoform X1 [Malaclemys terrapin pileata]XP_053878696.1 zinc finger protein 800 isoform X1 [Malaclemys terrapin pileata]XP_053878705.1 zinc finger protein 800 isoform X1 [Malaclemys terrapin pileata]XP_053878714.1 zinc finger protein 800 isoform X1 [Malaclemys terrapin pileata]XP_053878722.1 zinc finger protein 800 isoform X1 [Malaclemys terrapin pileata]
MPLRDKCCQTDHHHHGCCEPVYLLEPGDPPLLQQPLQMSKSGIQQIIECFRSGTKQLKHILLKDVDTIFECKICRSLFRGLPNLITHKKFYCPPSLQMDDNLPDVNDKQSQAVNNLLEAIYPRVDKQEYVIKLEPIETNQNAVFQYVSRTDNPEENIEISNSPDQAPLQIQEPTTEQPKTVSTPDTETLELPPADAEINVMPTPDEQPPALNPELDSSDNSDFGHQLICCLCRKEFHSRRSVRRHIRKVHKKKMEELKKYIETKKKPNQRSTKGRNKNVLVTLGRSCPVCYKSFATKANVRRHFDEVHRGLRRDSITPDIATKPGQPLFLDTVSAKKSFKTRKQKSSSKAEYNLTACKCLLCKRKYSSQIMLKRHMQIVHKITLSGKNSKREKGPNNTANGTEIKVKVEPADSVEPSTPSITLSPQNELKGTSHSNEKKNTAAAQKNKVKRDLETPKSTNPSAAGGQQKTRKPKLSAGFDFKQLYCKLCKRQFTSKQNLTKHIELHTDGNNIYVKFYRCPLCTYETRRKRDVIRHITVVHKKSSRYLGKITASLEIRAIKKPIDFVLNKVAKRGPQRDEARQIGSKQDVASNSPSKKFEGADVGIEVKVTKNFSLHRCNKCGKAFAKKTFLEHHKKTHKANASHSPEENKTKGRSTRSKALVW